MYDTLGAVVADLHKARVVNMGTSSKTSKRNFVPMVHQGTVRIEVVPMVKNIVNQGRCRCILYGYFNYLVKEGNIAMLFSVKIIYPCIRPEHSAEIEETYD